MDNTSNSLTTVAAQDGKSVSVVGDTYRIVIGGEQTNGTYALIDMLIPPEGGPGPHSHADVQEAFYIVDGEIEVTTKEKTYTAKKGDYVNIPFNGPVHKFTNKTNEAAHILCFVTPSGMENMFEEIGQPVTAGQFLPKPDMTPEMKEKFESIATKYGQKLYPPDYFE